MAYIVCSGLVDLDPFLQVPAAPRDSRVGLEVSAGSAKPWWHQAIALPRAFPAVERAKMQPDPAGKSSTRNANAHAIRAARISQLPDPLQQAAAERSQHYDRVADQDPPVPRATPLDSWQQQREAAARTDVDQPRAHLVYQHWPLEARQTSDLYGKWVAAFEDIIISHRKIENKEVLHYQGRAQGHQRAWRKTAAAPGRASLHDPSSEWWAEVA